MSQLIPGNLLDDHAAPQMKQTEILVGDPQTPLSVLCDGTRTPAGYAADWNKPVIVQVTEFAKRDNPNSPASILKKRARDISALPGLCGATAVNRKSPVIPSVQAAG